MKDCVKRDDVIQCGGKKFKGGKKLVTLSDTGAYYVDDQLIFDNEEGKAALKAAGIAPEKAREEGRKKTIA